MHALLGQAINAHQSGNLDEAEALYRDVLGAKPNLYEARYNLGMIYGKLGRLADAAGELALAAEARPESGDAWFMLCEFAGYAGQLELSRFAGEQAVRLTPDFARAWLRYGIALSRMDRNDEAIIAYCRALEIDPALGKAWLNLSVIYMNEARPAEAEAACRAALKCTGFDIGDEDVREVDENEYGLPHWHLALAELAQGKYHEGFAHFRARYKGSTDWKRFDDPRPLWKGEPLQCKSILVRVEQGHGDALMFCRYVPMLKQAGASRIIFQVHPALMRLFENWPGADEILSIDAKTAPATDFHTTIFDLPHRFGTTLETIPAAMPYLPLLAPDEKMRLTGEGRKVGVVWAGTAKHQNDKRRSLPLATVADLFNIPGWKFYSLTTDRREGDAETLAQFPVTDLAPRISDFADTARLIAQLDLVITCDTATAHLAGGMGKPVWTLLPFAADWRWLTGREDSPWYPTMRLFRQVRKNDWGDVVARVKEALPEFI